MKKICLSLSLVLFWAAAFGQAAGGEIAIVPVPVKLVRQAGTFTLPSRIVIEAPALPDLQTTLAFLHERLSAPTGYAVTVSQRAKKAAVRLQLNAAADPAIGKEGYQLTVAPGGITIRANQAAGLFYGVQTLMQLLPPEIESAAPVRGVAWQAPCVEITDYPRFGWRGLMFDVSRHFFTKEEVMAFIDQMARYKYNLFHWHLTDDEGWRVEIKSLPNLTQKGAWNVKKVGYFGNFSPPEADEPVTYGGFYTQDDIRQVVQYAKERFVNILPEVDVPGHSLAAVVSYPELSCTPGVEKYRVRSGEKIMDWRADGFTALVDNTLCPANENVYEFLDKVFTELAALFPFDYVHVGGDECAKNFWEKSEAVKALMQREGLKDMHEVQSYFEKRVEKIVSSKGKKFIGWDEVLEGGLAPNAAVMSWRGEKGGIEAARLKHEVVMSPTTYCYIDYMQGDPVIEPRVYATLRLNKAYQFDPVPEGVDPQYIKGGQANLWTEQVYNMRHAQYMTWPRAFATAECVWSPKENKDWNDFVRRVEHQFRRYDIREIKYAPSLYEPIFTARKDAGGQLLIELATEVGGLDIYYSFDNSFPDRFYPKYTEPLRPPKDAVILRVVTYRGKEQLGRLITVPLEEMQRRVNRQ